MDKQEAADAAHAPFRDETSDFLAYVKLWDFYHEQARHLSTSKLRKLCQTNFLSFVRMREWHDIHQQLHGLVGEMGLLRGGPVARNNGHGVKREDVKREGGRRRERRAPA